MWEYSLATDMLGRVVEAASGKRLADFLDERLFKPLAMNDTAFFVPSDKLGRLAEALPVDASTGKPNKLYRRLRGPEQRFRRRRRRVDCRRLSALRADDGRTAASSTASAS